MTETDDIENFLGNRLRKAIFPGQVPVNATTGGLAISTHPGTLVAMPHWPDGDENARYFFDVKDGHRLVDIKGTDCEDDRDAIEKAKALAIRLGADALQADPKRHIAVINSEGTEVSRVPVNPTIM